jgi:uncharacterized damage-inducible protein DinB
MLEAYLPDQRATLLSICAGLTGEQLAQRSAPPSTLSLLGIVRHLAKVERVWFRQRVAGEAIEPMYATDRGKDTDFDDTDATAAEADFARFEEEIRLADAAAAALSLDHTFVLRGERYSLRMVYLHMIAEYARHNGHADLLRERIDGTTGA